MINHSPVIFWPVHLNVWDKEILSVIFIKPSVMSNLKILKFWSYVRLIGDAFASFEVSRPRHIYHMLSCTFSTVIYALSLAGMFSFG